MGLEAVTTDAQNLGILLFKAFYVALKSLEFARSDRGKISVIEGQHQMFLAELITEMDGPLGRFR